MISNNVLNSYEVSKIETVIANYESLEIDHMIGLFTEILHVFQRQKQLDAIK